jgi:LPS sulfotransferase NodH
MEAVPRDWVSGATSPVVPATREDTILVHLAPIPAAPAPPARVALDLDQARADLAGLDPDPAVPDPDPADLDLDLDLALDRELGPGPALDRGDPDQVPALEQTGDKVVRVAPDPEADASGSPGEGRPGRSYLICATPRTGSYLLCDALIATGIAGRPTEYFSIGYEQHWSPVWGTTDYASYLRYVVATTTTPNGVFGAKTHPWQFDYFARKAAGRAPVNYAERPAVLAEWFPNLGYVWLRRRNKLHQAISYAKSIETNVWWDAEAPPAPYDEPKPEALQFDFELITQSVARLVEEEDMWRRYFAAIGEKPLVIDYEDLFADPEAALVSVLDLLELDLPDSYTAPAPRFRRQADETTLEWEALYRRELARGPYVLWNRVKESEASRIGGTKGPTPEPPESETPKTRAPEIQTDPPVPPRIEIESLLGSRRWIRFETPFPHVYATEVFAPETYKEMANQFEGLLSGGHFSRSIPGYDVSAYTITGRTEGPLSAFTSREFHDTLARVFGVEATGELNIALHHHAIGSASGSPHNDLNPGWFAERRRSDGIVVLDPADGCDYRFGSSNEEIRTVERIRAVAVIFYLANPPGRYYGGETGLYRAASDPMNRPASAIGPRNNSLIAFECTPWSFHGFMTNPRAVRNCLVMWLHRDKNEVTERFGGSSIVYWSR